MAHDSADLAASLPRNDECTLITLYELDQLNPRPVAPGTPAFPDHVITAALCAQDRVKGYTPSVTARAAKKELFGAVRDRMLSIVPDGMGVKIQEENDLGRTIRVALNNLVEFDMAVRIEAAPIRRNCKLRFRLASGAALIAQYEYREEVVVDGCSANPVPTLAVDLLVGDKLIDTWSSVGDMVTELKYAITPDGRLMARSLLVEYGSSSKPAPQAKKHRPADTSVQCDRRWADAWRSGRHTTIAKCAQELGVSARDLRRAIDRDRKRRK